MASASSQATKIGSGFSLRNELDKFRDIAQVESKELMKIFNRVGSRSSRSDTKESEQAPEDASQASASK